MISLKVDADIVLVIKAWLSAWKPILPLLLIGSCSFFVSNSLAKYLVLALLFTIILILEFVFYPKMVSNAYSQIVYPQIESILNKLLRRNCS